MFEGLFQMPSWLDGLLRRQSEVMQQETTTLKYGERMRLKYVGEPLAPLKSEPQPTNPAIQKRPSELATTNHPATTEKERALGVLNKFRRVIPGAVAALPESPIVRTARRVAIQSAKTIAEIGPHCVAMNRPDLLIDLSARTISVDRAKQELLQQIDFAFGFESHSGRGASPSERIEDVTPNKNNPWKRRDNESDSNRRPETNTGSGARHR